MTEFSGPPSIATRNQPISSVLRAVLEAAADSAGIDTISITSGGQDALGEGTRRTGSTRHDRGRAADLQCSVGGKTLTFTNQAANPTIVNFLKAAAAAGASGIGAGTDYMGNSIIHVGFGMSEADHSKLTWGRDGRSANAPGWLRNACAEAWADPLAIASPTVPTAPIMIGAERYLVIARAGLRLRGGPGTEFDVQRVLPLGTELWVVAVESSNQVWALVDLQGDGYVDGYVHRDFLAPATHGVAGELAREPDDHG